MHASLKALTLTLGTAIAATSAPSVIAGAPLLESTPIAHAKITSVHGSPASAGIKLLEDIFQHMHQLPQLAMQKMTPTIAMAQREEKPLFLQKSQVNDNLIIKPREKSRAMASKKEALPIDLLDDETVNKNMLASRARDKESSDARLAYNGGGAGGSAKSLGMANTAAGATQLAGSMRNAAAQMDQAISAKPSLPRGVSISDQHPGLIAFGESAKNFASITASMQRAQQMPMMSNSSSTPMSEALKQAALRKPGQQQQQLVLDERQSRRSIAVSPYVTEYRKEPRATPMSAPAQSPPLGQAAASSDEFADGAASPAASASPAAMPENPGVYRTTHEYGDAKSRGVRPYEIAMNSPNVINGIPLVRLGTLAGDAENTLKTSYDVKEQKVDGWTVCSGAKPHSSDPAVQLYIKHGMVEAMRIFDPALIPGDFGVRLGDNLQSLKSRFGEPAFLIREPAANTISGQNYVYPISQVSFQLSRVGKSAPKVVSVLIFNVK